jgi:NAD+ synthase
LARKNRPPPPPPGVKISSRNFGRDRRYPITNAFRDAR